MQVERRGSVAVVDHHVVGVVGIGRRAAPGVAVHADHLDLAVGRCPDLHPFADAEVPGPGPLVHVAAGVVALGDVVGVAARPGELQGGRQEDRQGRDQGKGHGIAPFSAREGPSRSGLPGRNGPSRIVYRQSFIIGQAVRMVNNAGSFFNTRRETKYGVEKTLLVNHLAPFLLTNLLIGAIQKSKSARIINVSSDAHQYGEIDFDDLRFKRGYVGMKAYARSKLANILFTYELVRRFPSYGLTVNALHPGHVATDMWKTNFSFLGPVLKWIMRFFSLSPEEGADNTIYLASSMEVEGLTGQYFVKREPVKSSPESYDEETASHLWEISEEITSLAHTHNFDNQRNSALHSGA